jgi:ankyrin repeat protein
MPNFKIVRSLPAVLLFGLLVGCAMSPDELAYRNRLDLGITAPQDIVRFRIPPTEQSALVAAASDYRIQYANAVDLDLMQAATAGDSERVKTLLSGGAQVNARDRLGNSALLNAAREGEVDIARILLKSGAQVNGRGGSMTPLAAAALRGHTILVRLLIRNGADIDQLGQNEQTALMNAVKLNRIETAKVLLLAGASTQLVDRNGDNLLAVAVNDNAPEMLSLLLQHGLKPDVADSNGLTPLYWANYLNRPVLAKILIAAGADPERTQHTRVVSRPYKQEEF